MSRVWPEIRVTISSSGLIRSVVWDPCNGDPPYDMTGMNVALIDKTVTPDGIPTTGVQLWARLVEVQE